MSTSISGVPKLREPDSRNMKANSTIISEIEKLREDFRKEVSLRDAEINSMMEKFESKIKDLQNEFELEKRRTNPYEDMEFQASSIGKMKGAMVYFDQGKEGLISITSCISPQLAFHGEDEKLTRHYDNQNHGLIISKGAKFYTRDFLGSVLVMSPHFLKYDPARNQVYFGGSNITIYSEENFTLENVIVDVNAKDILIRSRSNDIIVIKDDGALICYKKSGVLSYHVQHQDIPLPQAISEFSNGEIVIGCLNGLIQVVTLSPFEVKRTLKLPDGFRINYMKIDKKDNIFLCDTFGDRFLIVNMSGDILYSKIIKKPYCASVDNEGNIYLGCVHETSLLKGAIKKN